MCKKCSPKVESTSRKNGCASCEEIQHFKLDLMKVAIASGSADILGRAQNLCESIDTMVGHIQRMSNQVCLDCLMRHVRTHRMFTFMYTYTQERYWPHLLDQMRKSCFRKVEEKESEVDSDEEARAGVSNEYDHVLLKSDYWKKFEGTIIKEGLSVGKG